MKLGIVGLPNVGKSTLFNAITKAGAESANYPFCTIEPNVGVVSVPDERLDRLTEMHKSKKTIPAAVEFYDIAGLVKGASKGEGLGNKFLSHIREVEAIVHVVRCFEDPNVVHVDGTVDPQRDIDVINLELILSDLEMVEKRMQKLQKTIKSDKNQIKNMELLKRLYSALEEGLPARSVDYDDSLSDFVKNLYLLTTKPVIYVANVSEDDALNSSENPLYEKVKEIGLRENAEVIKISAKLEAELLELEDDEKALYMEELGMDETGLHKLIQAGYAILGLISFLTSGEPETRAWTIVKGSKAPQAAGKIHTDFEKGFIRAEVVSYDDLLEAGSLHAAKEKGILRLEGKDYVVKDGDVIHFRFNV
ncbi:MAG: redox-regulated ATPase YchF [Clostridiales bacterium]|nr:MAG: redox-regulated ATPase YchF [Clostridiales bacterium]